MSMVLSYRMLRDQEIIRFAYKKPKPKNNLYKKNLYTKDIFSEMIEFDKNI